MSFFGFCCVDRFKDKSDGSTPTGELIGDLRNTSLNLRHPNTPKVLAHFTQIEARLFSVFENTSLVDIQRAVLDQANDISELVNSQSQGLLKPDKKQRKKKKQYGFAHLTIGRQACKKLLEQTEGITKDSILRAILKSNTLVSDNDQEYYDVEKLFVFLILYADCELEEKAQLLFDMLENPNKECLQRDSPAITRIMQYIIEICCITIGFIINMNSHSLFLNSDSSEVEVEFKELFNLYLASKQSVIMQDFTLEQKHTVLFPGTIHQGINSLERIPFVKKLASESWIFVDTNLFRSKFTQFVYTNEYKIQQFENVSDDHRATPGKDSVRGPVLRNVDSMNTSLLSSTFDMQFQSGSGMMQKNSIQRSNRTNSEIQQLDDNNNQNKKSNKSKSQSRNQKSMMDQSQDSQIRPTIEEMKEEYLKNADLGQKIKFGGSSKVKRAKSKGVKGEGKYNNLENIQESYHEHGDEFEESKQKNSQMYGKYDMGNLSRVDSSVNISRQKSYNSAMEDKLKKEKKKKEKKEKKNKKHDKSNDNYDDDGNFNLLQNQKYQQSKSPRIQQQQQQSPQQQIMNLTPAGQQIPDYYLNQEKRGISQFDNDQELLFEQDFKQEKKSKKSKKKDKYEQQPVSPSNLALNLSQLKQQMVSPSQKSFISHNQSMHKSMMNISQISQSNPRMSVMSHLHRATSMTNPVVKDVETHLIDLFGEQLHQLVYLLSIEGQAEFEEDNGFDDVDHEANRKLLKSREDRFRQNKKRLLANKPPFELEFPTLYQSQNPNGKSLSPHVKEVLLLFQQTVKADDMIQLYQGTLFNEAIINLYYKILEKINLVLVTAYNHLKAQTPASANDVSIVEDLPECDKVMYLNSQFVRKLRQRGVVETLQAAQVDSKNNRAKNLVPANLQELTKVFESDILLVPFFFDDAYARNGQTAQSTKTFKTSTPKNSERKDNDLPPGLSGTVLVTINTQQMEIDLYQSSKLRESEMSETDDEEAEKNQIISDEIINMLELGSKFSSTGIREFNEDQVDGGFKTVTVACEEDYLVAMAYIAEQFTFKRAIDLDKLNIERERSKMVDVLLQFLQMH